MKYSRSLYLSAVFFLQNVCKASFFVYLCVKFNLFHLRLFFVFFYKISVGNKFLIIFARIINFFIKVFLDVKQSIVGFIINSHYVFFVENIL